MSNEHELAQQINQIGEVAWRRLMLEQHGLFTFHQFGIGDSVVIDTVADDIPGVDATFGQTLMGEITDTTRAQFRVVDALHQKHLIGWEIFMATVTDLATPGGIMEQVTLKHCMGPNRRMAYVFRDSKEQYIHFTSTRYGRVAVNGVVLFDVIRW